MLFQTLASKEASVSEGHVPALQIRKGGEQVDLYFGFLEGDAMDAMIKSFM